MVDLAQLPNDPEKLKAIISTQIQDYTQQIQSKDNLITTKEKQIQSIEEENEVLREALRLARIERFAKQSEKLPSDQSELFDEAEALSDPVDTKEDPEDIIEVPAHKHDRGKRKPLPDHLPREDVIIDLTDDEKVCAKDGTPLKEIGSEVSEQLDVIPAQFKVIRTIRKKYICPCCDESIKTASSPEKILPKSNATPGLLAYIAINKYIDALPLYRIENIFKRYDVEIPRNTMARWMIELSERLTPLYNIMEEDLLSADFVSCDETKVQVLKEPGKEAESQSYMWVRTRHGPGISPIILFDYDPTRKKEVPNRLLKDFKGYLQVDGYAGYDAICKLEDVTRVACMAHIRRKFFDVNKASKKKSAIANRVLKLIQKLYKIEVQIKEAKIAERFKQRQAEAPKVLDQLKEIIDENENRHPPKGLLGKAFTYAKNQWPFMMNYLKDGRLSIDNNFTENRIRPFAIGRKNWLFSDSQAGAKASAMIYSILQTARGNGLEPYAYMRYLLTELPKCQSIDQIENLLPYNIDPKILN